MVIEHFKDKAAIGERFARMGRMLPEGVVYHSSWIDPSRDRCFQLMEAPDAAKLEPWIDSWKDLTDFEVIPVVTSAQFWSGT